MAEYCVECLNALSGKNIPEKKYILTKDCEVCECCEQLKRVVVRYRRPLLLEILRKITLVIKLLFYPIFLLFRFVKRMIIKRTIKVQTNKK